ncbi:hypothetical protein FQR65_LT16356 [Abscondita terminalis]|nr:hypothetical protein FQR65_LT16356 [Abscondita terminalis]
MCISFTCFVSVVFVLLFSLLPACFWTSLNDGGIFDGKDGMVYEMLLGGYDEQQIFICVYRPSSCYDGTTVPGGESILTEWKKFVMEHFVMPSVESLRSDSRSRMHVSFTRASSSHTWNPSPGFVNIYRVDWDSFTEEFDRRVRDYLLPQPRVGGVKIFFSMLNHGLLAEPRWISDFLHDEFDQDAAGAVFAVQLHVGITLKPSGGAYLFNLVDGLSGLQVRLLDVVTYRPFFLRDHGYFTTRASSVLFRLCGSSNCSYFQMYNPCIHILKPVADVSCTFEYVLRSPPDYVLRDCRFDRLRFFLQLASRRRKQCVPDFFASLKSSCPIRLEAVYDVPDVNDAIRFVGQVNSVASRLLGSLRPYIYHVDGNVWSAYVGAIESSYFGSMVSLFHRADVAFCDADLRTIYGCEQALQYFFEGSSNDKKCNFRYVRTMILRTIAATSGPAIRYHPIRDEVETLPVWPDAYFSWIRMPHPQFLKLAGPFVAATRYAKSYPFLQPSVLSGSASVVPEHFRLEVTFAVNYMLIVCGIYGRAYACRETTLEDVVRRSFNFRHAFAAATVVSHGGTILSNFRYGVLKHIEKFKFGEPFNSNTYRMYVKDYSSSGKTSTNKLALELEIGGQTISQFHKRLKRCQCPNYTFELGNKITILIGSNDILKDHSFTTMRNGITRLSSQLNTSVVNDVRIMTITPILSGSKLQQKNIKYINNFLLK